MLVIGKPETDFGQWCGAKKLNKKAGQWQSFDDNQKQQKKGDAAVRSCKPIWMTKWAILLCDVDELASRKEFTNPHRGWCSHAGVERERE